MYIVNPPPGRLKRPRSPPGLPVLPPTCCQGAATTLIAAHPFMVGAGNPFTSFMVAKQTFTSRMVGAFIIARKCSERIFFYVYDTNFCKFRPWEV